MTWKLSKVRIMWLRLVENAIDSELFPVRCRKSARVIPYDWDAVYDYIFQQMMGSKKIWFYRILSVFLRIAVAEADQSLLAFKIGGAFAAGQWLPIPFLLPIFRLAPGWWWGIPYYSLTSIDWSPVKGSCHRGNISGCGALSGLWRLFFRAFRQ